MRGVWSRTASGGAESPHNIYIYIPAAVYMPKTRPHFRVRVKRIYV